jgi:hypothetical protein
MRGDEPAAGADAPAAVRRFVQEEWYRGGKTRRLFGGDGGFFIGEKHSWGE